MVTIDDLEELNKAGIKFTVHLYDGFYDLSPERVFEYINNPELFEAKTHHVSLENWQKWKKHYENPCCQAITKKGHPCKVFPGQLGLHEFISKNCNVFCSVHELK